ncbi:trypsin-like serine protease [Marinagarivorans cellulosilyticus]|uniref:Peptidase S1 domain-containing protein n=1 Tax=Marinagarivorans cellulosilyticus TaxID=2721545 RepID=A0AAN1WGP6_9GAMM|nr:trypsin-like serine protease [Marinagarivorans cellulosilyticus]BCD97259.1 hypothetical protein MARGE09_P1460 [Marinagarivorans cellulosilyticus]
MKLIKNLLRLSAGLSVIAMANTAFAGTVYKHEVAEYLASKVEVQPAPVAARPTSWADRHSRVFSPAPRIVGGGSADPADWPYIVSLVQKGANPLDGHFCGGSLIRPDVVLTASHCVDGAGVNSFDVYVGSNILSDPGATGEIIGVKKIKMHEDFSLAALSNDIALIFLERATNLPTLPTLSSEQMMSVNVGDAFKVAGWGNMDPNFPEFPDFLQEVDVQHIDPEICNEAYEPIFGPDTINETMICAGTFVGGKDSCHGDSGGPLVVEVDGEPHQVGVVSFGNGSCADPGFFGVYAKVPHFEAWIARNLSTKIIDHPVQDINLQACIDNAAQAAGWTDITEVISLQCDAMGITNLQGIESYENIFELSLGDNPISDITPLEKLTQLQFLNLSGTLVDSLNPLARLTQLSFVMLFDIEGVDCLDVNSGVFTYDDIANACFNFVADIVVEDPGLQRCITGMAEFNDWLLVEEVEGLSCFAHDIHSLSGIEQLNHLFYIFADQNQIQDVSPLASMQRLELLVLEGNNISDISALEELTSLFLLVLWNNQVSDISALSNMTSLVVLDLENNNVSDISALENLVNLQTILLVNNPVTCMDVSAPFSYLDIPSECFAPPVVFIDTDGDGWFDFEDNCPNKANANQKDTDADGIGNRCDSDDDNDGFSDAEENQVGSNPRNPNSTPISILTDWDSDGLLDENDNCPNKANANQKDFDLDGMGDACDSDDDNDGFTDAQENNAGSLPRNPNSTPMTVIIDFDNDGIVDWEDNCMEKANANQKDFDRDGLGDACDSDDDNDGFSDAEENNAGSKPKNPQSTPITIIDDSDSDGIPNSWDNCVDKPNANQKDTDQDGLGNACDRDDDNDGFSDVEEKLAGTHPRNPASFPAG